MVMGPEPQSHLTSPIQAPPMESIQFNTVCGSMLYARPPLRRPLHISESPVESTAHHAHPAGQLPNHPTTARTTAPLARQQTPSNSTFKFKGPAGRPSIARGLLLNQLATWSISINIHAKAPLKTEQSTASVARSMIMRRRGGAVASAAWVVLGVAVAAASAALLLADAAHDYEEALRKSLVYFEAQRSGRLPHGQRVAWRDHSGLTDGLEQGVDLVGGYYDAGDHVKFGLPMAFTVTMLSWSLLEYGADVAAAGELAHALESIKWGTDYFIKAHTQPDELWAEVGDGDTDHYCWQRPEDMTTSRQAYKVDRDRPGSDVAGETAAALAAASMAFRDTNPHYAHLLLHHAQQLFEFADKYRGKYDSSIAEVKSYYASVSGYHDELLWAALWLHRATGRASYLDYVVDNADAFGGTGWAITEFSWDVKYAGVQILATRLLLLQGEHTERQRETLEGYRAKAEHYVCACMGKNNNENNNVERSPGGMLYVRQWNNMQYVTSAAFLLSVYSGYLTEAGGGSESVACGGGVNGEKVGAEEVFSEAKAQVDYVLGSNPRGMSYLVGYGAKYPTRVHHRAASIVPYKDAKAFIGCAQGFDDWFGRRSANPNVVVGAIVGGPDRKDRFRDDRDNYMQTEACTYNTAPMVGIFAMLHRLQQEESSPSSATATLQPENGGTSSTATATG